MAQPQKYDHEQIFRLRESGETFKTISAKVGSSHQYLWKICTEGGIKPLKPKKAQNKQIQIDLVLDYIRKNGGVVAKVIRHLDLELYPATVRTAAKRRGMDLRDYYHYKRENRNWIVDKPGFKRHPTGYTAVTATCKHCGHEQQIRVTTLDTSRTAPICESCGGKRHFKH